MSALTAEHEPRHGLGWDELVRVWEQTDAPEGWKVEIIEGIVTMAPPPTSDHNDTADELQRALYSVIPRDWGIYQTIGVSIPRRRGLYIPDLAVIPKERLPRLGTSLPAGEAELIVEITSKYNASNDRLSKLDGYASAGVPLYLLLDPWNSSGPRATLHRKPESGAYRVVETVEYGKGLYLPKPFDVTVDTGAFPIG